MNQKEQSINLFGEDYGHEFYDSFVNSAEVYGLSHKAFACTGAVVSNCGDRFGNGVVSVQRSNEKGSVELEISELHLLDEDGPEVLHLGSINIPAWLAIKLGTELLVQAQKAIAYNTSRCNE